ncbi:aldehyde dehydrogenase family protein [Halorarum halobium]|uniref:aldehyde dehydrogenase family protein n=1 Tax=Halorarum halobium TaxID=3075121 RepID=UPI0028AA4013|nr:aldehyde dehydrogenase family protein [Halobaculum sp. XH14]
MGDTAESIRQKHEETAAEVVPEELGLFIGGEFVDAASGETFETRDPTTGDVLADVPAGGPEDVDRAVRAASEAYEGEWGEQGASDRQRLLHEIADRIEAERKAFAMLESLDNGKPTGESFGDVAVAADHFRFFAAATRLDEGITLPADDGPRHVSTVQEPFGVVGQITPWNFPLLMAAWKLAPALAAGNAVVLKPAEETPLSALKLAGILGDVLPDGAVNVVTGFGEEAGAPLTEHPDVGKVAFTGSTPVGKQVMKAAAERIADVTLELGGKSPLVVHPDVDVEKGVRAAVLAIFYNTGECCTAGSRLFVHEDVADEFLDALVEAAEGLTMGDPLERDTRLGPKVSPEQVDRTMSFVEDAREEGATFLTGGEPVEDPDLAGGSFVAPTIVEGLDHDSDTVQQEIFGPVLEVFRWDDYDEMMTLANDVDYGLAAGVLATDIETAYRTAKDIEAGTVWVNQYQDFPAGMPFGGYKQSGIGRETAFETVNHYTRTKSIDVSLR